MAVHPYAELKVDSEHFQLLEHFTIIVYDKTSDLQHVNEARQEMFCQKEKSMERLPPTQDALMQHTKRATYQAGIWCTSDQIEQHVPSPGMDSCRGHLDSCVDKITNSCTSV